jgi:hypothetical protein
MKKVGHSTSNRKVPPIFVESITIKRRNNVRRQEQRRGKKVEIKSDYSGA